MHNWTDEQLRAIETAGAPIIVSAAAGSGKTAVLVERTVRLLCDKSRDIPADTLLAVTFTNDAASQMSQKLSQELDIRADLEPDNEWIQRQQALLRLAEITTINSFCYSLVRDNLSDTDFQSGLRILEENEAAMLTDRALTAVLEAEYAGNPEQTEELISLFCRENDSMLRKMILQLYRFLRSLPFPKVWCKKVIDDLRTGVTARNVEVEFERMASETLALAEGTLRRLQSAAEALECHANAKRSLLENCATAEEAIRKLRSVTRADAAEIVSAISWTAIKGSQTKAEKELNSELEAGIYESAKGCNAHLKDLFKELAGIYRMSSGDVDGDAEKVAKYFEILVGICEKLDAELHSMKVERNAVDFADTELMSVNLLINCDENGNLSRTPLAEEIVRSRRYRVILIDEFQDVNNLQEVIFKAISDTDDLTEIGRNVFVVGDVKQAIYRFRLANPQIFMRTRAQGHSPDSPIRELLLRKNFRSRRTVLDFCNYIFGAVMSERVGETEYTDDEMLIPGSEFTTSDEPTEIITVNSDCGEDLSFLEFTAIARRIRALIDEGTQVRDGDGCRNCRPSDFCVLTRNNVASSEIADIFGAEGLKILSSDTSGYLRSREISVLLNLLAIISNPMQDVPLASVMLSPIMGFTDDEIASLRLENRKEKLYKAVYATSVGERSADPKLREKCSFAVALIRRLSVYASGMTLTRLIRKIYDLTDIFAIASAYEDGDQKCANLYLLLEYARSYEQSSPDGISGFLRYIDYISESGGDFEQALTVTESEDAVVVKTIHRSKGLEYPFVFLCQTRKRFNQTDLTGRLQLNTERGAGLSFLDYSTLTKRPTLYWEYIKNANKSELLSEELRLLYVAMTRAKERLFIILDLCDAVVNRAKELSYEISNYVVAPAVAQKAVCIADWLLMALMKHPGFSVLRSKLDSDIYSDRGELPAIKVTAMPSSASGTKPPEAVKAGFDPELVNRLLENFNTAPEERLTQNEAKLTVSEIVKDDALSFFPRIPSLDESLEEFTSAQRGTITHKFMQFCDFAAASRDLEAEITRLTIESVFTSREAGAIDRRSVRRFFESNIYKRLSASGKVMREKQFIIRFDDIEVDESLKKIYRGTEGMLQGIADCLFEEEDGYVLVDYKTDRVRLTAELAERYQGQLSLYKAAFDALLDKPIKSSYIYSFCLGEGIELEL